MSSLNRVYLAGNLTRAPELKQTTGGVAVAHMGLAVNERFKNRDGEAVERTCFVDIEAWGRQAETCAQYLDKGAGVLVEGALLLDRWETGEGATRTKLKVRANRVQFIGRARSETGGDTPESAPEPQTAEALPF